MSNPMSRYLATFLRLRMFEAFRYREFRLLSFGQISGNMGTWMDEVTRGWLIYELTNSALQLGLVRGIQLIPFILLSPIAGSAADRYSRRAQLLIAQSLNVIIYAATAGLVLTGMIRPWHVYVTALLVAVVQVFQQPARSAMISDSVPQENLTNAIGLGALLFNVARIVGPALAGLVIAAWSTGGAFLVQTAFLCLATAWTLQLRPERRHSMASAAAQKESFGQSIIEGWKFSWRTEPIRAGLIVTALVSLLIVPFTTLLPVFARDLLGVGPRGQGLLLTATGCGALISAVLIASAGNRLARGMLMLGSSMIYGLVLLIFAASPWFSLSLVTMVFAGLCHVHANALVMTIIQSHSPAKYRGRTLAIFSMSQVLTTAGAMLIGVLSVPLGPRGAVAAMSVAGSLAILTLYVMMPKIRHIK